MKREIAQLTAGKATWNLEMDSTKKICIVYENSKVLLDIFSNIKEEKQKSIFKEALIDEITSRQEKYSQQRNRFGEFEGELFLIGTSALSFFTLLKLGFVDKAIEAYQIRVWDDNCLLLFMLLESIFKEEYNYFTIKQLNELTTNFPALETKSKYTFEASNRILSYITDYGFEILKNEIKGVNIEINRDKDSVVNKISILGLDSSYEQFLNELDEYISTSSGIVASGMISNFRSFWEKIIIDIAIKISKKLGITIPKTTESQVGNARAFLKVQLELSDCDHSFASRFVEILNSEGGHAFTSNVAYFRLTRNIGIEILLLYLTKAENIYIKKS